MEPTTLIEYLKAQFIGKYLVYYSVVTGTGRRLTTKKPITFGLKALRPTRRHISEIIDINFNANRIERKNYLCEVYLIILVKDESLIIQLNKEIQILNKKEIKKYRI